MKKITFPFFLLLAAVGWAQNGGDTCDTAVVISPGDFTSTTITQDTEGGEQGTPQPRDAAWFSYTPEGDGTISISACALGTDTRLFVGTGDCGSLTTVVSDDDSCDGTFSSVIEDFVVTSGTTYLIEWDDRWNGSELPFDWTLTFTPPPACPAPIDFSVGGITDTSAVLSWSDIMEASQGYEWIIMEDGEDPEDENNTPVAMGTTGAGEVTATVSGLTETNDYDAYVRSNCDADGFSEYSDAVEFSTICPAEIPDYLESFNEGVVPPDCWTEASNGLPSEGPMNLGAGSWLADDYLNDTVASGDNDNSARINLFFNSAQDWLISPIFDLSGGDYELVYNVGVTDFGNQNASPMGSDDEVQVLISEDNGLTWTALVVYNIDNTPSNTGQEEIIDLTSYDTNVQFAFWGSEGTVNDSEDYDVFIDEFQVRIPLSCVAPEVVFQETADCDNGQYTIDVLVVELGSADSLTVSDDQDSEDQTVEESATTVTFGPYPTGTAVVITITGDDADCTITQNIQYTCPPSNNLCETALALVTGENFEAQAITVDNIGATDSEAIDPTCANYDGGDIWFTAIIPSNGILNIESNSSEESAVEDTGMEAYTGSCEDLTLIECDDDDSEDGLFSLISIDDESLAGQTIYIRVWEWSNDAFGEFQVSVYNEDILKIDTFNSENRLSLYPNPTSNELNIKNLPAKASVIITNVLGQEIFQSTAGTLNVSSLKTGMYFVTILDGSSSQTLRFIKK